MRKMHFMPKKILLATRPLVPPWDEASKNFAYFLARSVDSPNLSLHLLTERGQERLPDMPQSVVEHPIYPPNTPGQAGFPFSQKIKFPLYLAQHAREFAIIHYLFTPARLNARINRLLTPKTVKTIQTVATLRDDLYSPRTLKGLFFADRLITYTDATKHKLEALGLTNVTRVYPGIDLERYSPRGKSQSILTELGLKPEHFIVMYPGEYTRLGATDMLTDTFIDYFQKNPDTDLRFVFACRVKNEADRLKKIEVRERFAEAGLLDYVAFSDTISDMAALYNTADVIIFPIENLKGKFDVPLIIIEAYACSKPVILSDLPQFSEFTNGDICVTIPKAEGGKLIESLAYLKQNVAERVRLGQNARRYVEEHFDLKNTAKHYSEIYDSL